MANRLPLEEQTGADLIYYNETFRSFILVQYKAMEEGSHGPEFRWQLNDHLADEINRMNKLLMAPAMRQQDPPGRGVPVPADIPRRQRPDPCCRRSAPPSDPAPRIQITELDERLEKTGLPANKAMQQFDAWLSESTGQGCRPVFVGLNAPFDWSFVNYYFHRFLGRNPFGFTALDIKAYYMGATGCSWADTRSSRMAETLAPEREPDHQALSDAQQSGKELS
jgi:hypothetical protein